MINDIQNIKIMPLDLEGVLHSCKDYESNVVLIMAHGFRGSMDGGGRAKYLACLASEFCDVLRFNFTADQKLTDQVVELTSVINFVKNKFPSKKIVLLGRSMGGAASLIVAEKNKNISGLILWATPNNLRATFLQVLGKDLYDKLDAGDTLFLEDERGKVIISPDFLTDFDKYDFLELLTTWNRPILIIHGSSDNVVSLNQAKYAFSKIKRENTMKIIEDADHSFTEHGKIATEEVVDWLKRYFV